MNPDDYLSRMGVADDGFATVTDIDRSVETLAHLQRAHVATIPWETLAITGDPYGDFAGEGVILELAALYEKIVQRERGGFCYELNGLFGWLLDEGGFDVERRGACVLGDDGDPSPPANHLTHVVTLDEQRYVVDVGLGAPVMRQPIPLDGTPVTDGVGATWRFVESDRPDADYLAQFRRPDDQGWTDRYIFSDVPRELSYFEATCEYLQTAPESPFTGDPVVSRATADGHVKLKPDTLTRFADGETTEESVDESTWYRLLDSEFGLEF